MGAQTVERKHKFIQRFNEVEKSEGECFGRLIDNRGLKTPKNTQKLCRAVAKGNTMPRRASLTAVYKLIDNSKRNVSCKYCLMCLVLLHSVLFPWTGKKATAKSNVR